ncbi:hypothetical protein LEP1GSC165_0044 [Leptospira santarosai str. CBC523]|nr:hypothetical protein LEP1GSC165_0044 [Leptospira santarosai str. CBC523]
MDLIECARALRREISKSMSAILGDLNNATESGFVGRGIKFDTSDYGLDCGGGSTHTKISRRSSDGIGLASLISLRIFGKDIILS